MSQTVGTTMSDFKYKHGLVVFSGGQDSTTCLGVALEEAELVSCLTFDYGQRHINEIRAAEHIIEHFRDQELVIQHDIIDLSPVLQNMLSSGLVNNHIDVSSEHKLIAGLPASFVPARNALFLTSAFGIAIEAGCDAIYTGVCQTDYSGYPDCRAEFIDALNFALNVGYQQNIKIETPLMNLTKAETFALAAKVDVLQVVMDYSMTCYNGDETPNDFGKGCSGCPACQLRSKGWGEYYASLQG